MSKERKSEDEAAQNRIQNAEEKFKKQKKLEQQMKDKQIHRTAHGEERAVREGFGCDLT